MKNTMTALTIALLFSTSPAFADTSGHAMMDHSKVDHSKMDHGTMSQNTMNHEGMDMSGMDHSGMSMEGMSEVGMPAKGAKPNKVVHVLLSDDMKITFKKEVTIAPDDVVQFVVMNTGKVDHEFTIGSAKEQLAHREMMKSMTHHQHDSGNSVTVKPGKAKQILWHFHGAKDVEFACNMPGHAEAGMVKKVTLN